MPNLTDTVAVVTGASRGVGRGIALSLGEAGATVYVTGRSVAGNTTEDLPGTATETAEMVTDRGGEGIAVRCDHTVDADVEALFARVDDERPHLDLLVNNVWGGYEGYDATFDDPFWTQSMDRWAGMFDAGVRAHYGASRLAARRMVDRGEGLIVNISSGDADKYRGSVMYDVAKTAVDRLAKAMAYELRDHSVAAVSLYPGFVRTERVVQTFEEAGEDVPEETHSPAYVGRAVAALAADPEVMEKSGRVLVTGALAREYGFTDADGTQPPPFELETESL